MKEIAKLKIIVIENESLKKTISKLNETREYKQGSWETNESLNNIKLNEALKEETMLTMRPNVSVMKNVWATKLWPNTFCVDVVSNFDIMQVRINKRIWRVKMSKTRCMLEVEALTTQKCSSILRYWSPRGFLNWSLSLTPQWVAS